MAGVALLMALVLKRTVIGTHAYAIGSNEAAARLCGIPIARTKIAVYALAGLLIGLAGVMQFARLTVGDPTAAVGIELDIIAAVVIGGASLAGGEGSILGSIIGAFVMSCWPTAARWSACPNYLQRDHQRRDHHRRGGRGSVEAQKMKESPVLSFAASAYR